MKMHVKMTRVEVEAALLAAINVYGGATVRELYFNTYAAKDEFCEFEVERDAEAVPAGAALGGGITLCSTQEAIYQPPAFGSGTEQVQPTSMQLPIVHPERTLQDWYPNAAAFDAQAPCYHCACEKFSVQENCGWVDETGALHQKTECEPTTALGPVGSMRRAAAAAATKTIDPDDGLPF